MHRATGRFWQCFDKLPNTIQDVARDNFDILKFNPRHPSLYFKKVGKFWSARIGLNHRALAVDDGNDFIWVWIGPHDRYERMIKKG